MRDFSELSIEELAAVISDSLRKQGIAATLSGGACAQIYTSKEYVTGDLDFVVNYLWPKDEDKIENVMSGLGFKRNGRIFTNDSVAYSVEFPPGPLGIGEQYRIQPVEIELKTGTLSLLSPTDSAKDRLVSYFYANDRQCLEQAVRICQLNDVDMDGIRKWARSEGRPEKFAEFERRLSDSANSTL
jgi:hypothetical protein